LSESKRRLERGEQLPLGRSSAAGSFKKPLEGTMTATSLTYLAAREHIDDLRRDADRHRRAAQARPARRVRLSILRALARRNARAATTRASDLARA
jgi:hypothetical protein